MSLRATDLHFRYPAGPQALAGVDLELAAGELVCLLGPNGAGKSTLLRAVAGLLRPDRGRVLWDGRGVEELGAKERARRLALVPQHLERLPQGMVEDFVAGGRYGHAGLFSGDPAGDRRAVEGALEACGVTDLATRGMGQLSGGQFRRVLVARALAQEAPTLLVDEPTNSLDPEHQLGVFELLSRLACEWRSALVVTHDLNLASQFASRVVLLVEGRVVAAGHPCEILKPEVLGPVYGERLSYGRMPVGGGRGERPFVIPWLPPDPPRPR